MEIEVALIVGGACYGLMVAIVSRVAYRMGFSDGLAQGQHEGIQKATAALLPSWHGVRADHE